MSPRDHPSSTGLPASILPVADEGDLPAPTLPDTSEGSFLAPSLPVEREGDNARSPSVASTQPPPYSSPNYINRAFGAEAEAAGGEVADSRPVEGQVAIGEVEAVNEYGYFNEVTLEEIGLTEEELRAIISDPSEDELANIARPSSHAVEAAPDVDIISISSNSSVSNSNSRGASFGSPNPPRVSPRVHWSSSVPSSSDTNSIHANDDSDEDANAESSGYHQPNSVTIHTDPTVHIDPPNGRDRWYAVTHGRPIGVYDNL